MADKNLIEKTVDFYNQRQEAGDEYRQQAKEAGDRIKQTTASKVLRGAISGPIKAVNEAVEFGDDIYDYFAGNPYDNNDLIDIGKLGLEVEGDKEDWTYTVPQAITQFLLPMGLVSGATRKAITNPWTRNLLAGAVTDAVVQDPYEENLFNMLDKVPWLASPVTEILKAKTEEEIGVAEARLRQTGGGALLGETVTGVALGLKQLKKAPKAVQERILKRLMNDENTRLVHATSDNIDNLGDEIIPEFDKLSNKSKQVLEAIQSGKEADLSKEEILESIQEIGQKYPEKLTPKLRKYLGIDSKTTGRQKILPGTPHPTDAKKVRGYDGRWVTKKHFDQVTESRKGANEIRAQFDQPVSQETSWSDALGLEDAPPIGTNIPRGETATSGAVFIERVDKGTGQTGPIAKAFNLPRSYDLVVLELQELNAKQLAELGIKKADIPKLTPRKTINLLKKNFDNVRKDLLPGEYRMEGYSESRRKLYKKWFKNDPDVIWVDRQTGATSTIDDEMSIPYLTVKDQPVDAGGGGAVPPRKPPSGSSGADVPPSGKKKQDLGDPNILPNQVNPEQIGNTPSQVRFLEKVLRGMKLEEDASGFYRVKTNEDTVDEVIQLLQDSSALKEKAKFMAQIYKLIPSDSLNRALAEYVTLTNQRIANTNGSLIEALGTLDNPQQIEDLSEQLIKNFDDLDEWLRLGMPLRSEAGLALGSLAAPTKGIEPEEWLKLSPNERYRINKAQSGDVNIATGHSSVKLKNLQKNIRKAVAEGKESGDFSKLNKLVNTVKRAKGNPEKLEKLVGMELLDRILDPNTYLRPLNEVLINAVLYSPTTQEINFVSNALEAYMAPLELALDPKNIIDPGQLRMAKEHFIAMHSDFNFALKAFKESWQKQENVLAPGRIKSDFEDRFVISMDDEGLTYGDNFRQKLLADSINFFGDYIVRPSGRFMGSMDALFMSGAMRGSSVSRAWLGGWEKGLRGQELADYTKKHSGAVWESIVKRSGKGITDAESAEIYESVKEFGKRST